MRDVDLDRLRELAGQLRSAVRELTAIGEQPPEVFLQDPRSINSAKYLFIVASQAALDICNHLAAKTGGRSPADYSDCIAVLAEIGVLDDELMKRLVKMVKFRNLLVHLYWKLDDAELYRIMRENLGDFDRYLTAIGRHVRAHLL